MNIIEFSKLSKKYTIGGNTIFALNNIELTIQKKQLVSIIGASGSGKSTMLNILGCLDSPTSGEYFLNNSAIHSLSDVDKAVIRNKEIGFVFQNFNLLPRYSAIENIMLPLEYAGIDKKTQRHMAEEAICKVNLQDRMLHRPNEMSGGQRQRIAIARALVNNPTMILADEPTGNLDSKSAASIIDLMHEIHAAGNTVIIVTHDNAIAGEAQRVIALKDGQIVKDYLNR